MRRLLPLLAMRRLLSLLALAPLAAEASITGVCPDGSIFIVQDRSAIPCKAAKEVEPGEIPPVRPEYLPRPYTWQVYRESANPNNPYNLIDQAREVRRLRGNLPGAGGAAAQPLPTPGVSAPPQRRAGSVPSPPGTGTARAPAPLTFDADEIRDLFFIVELSQDAAPARFVREDARGEARMELAFAHSPAFTARLREERPAVRGGGAVLLFSVLAHAEERFDPHFTFVQGHESYRPRADDPAQMGFLEGGAGLLPAEGVALGYVVLPPRMRLAEPLDVYWNDRQLEARLQP